MASTPAPRPVAPSAKVADLPSSSIGRIDARIAELHDAIEKAKVAEDFELCIQLRGSIKKLKALREDAADFDISPAEINAA